MRVVIGNTPSAPWRAIKKFREPSKGAAAADTGEKKKDVIAANGLRPVLNAHAVFKSNDDRGENARVGIRREHGKPHAASTCYGVSGRAGRASCERPDCPVNRVDWRQVALPRISGTKAAMIRGFAEQAFPSKGRTAPGTTPSVMAC
jgi:hypothetical protein